MHKLREVMLHKDLEEVTSKQLRLQLEMEMEMDLKDYRGYLDQQMLRILGQMERPSEILDYLYLVGCLSSGIWVYDRWLLCCDGCEKENY